MKYGLRLYGIHVKRIYQLIYPLSCNSYVKESEMYVMNVCSD